MASGGHRADDAAQSGDAGKEHGHGGGDVAPMDVAESGGRHSKRHLACTSTTQPGDACTAQPGDDAACSLAWGVQPSDGRFFA